MKNHKVKVSIPNEVLLKIKYLCKTIPKDEWSGPLFYTFTGDISKPETFEITVKDILPLDKGTSAYTSYQNDDRFVDYMEEDEERLDWTMGHCHSHNVMRVFFSGTDDAELTDNAPNYNFYLSLIVNNFMDMTARVAFVAHAQKSIPKVPFIAVNGEGNEYTLYKADFTVDKKKVFYYDCDIICDREIVTVPEDFEKKVAKILIPKPAPTPVTHTPYQYNGQHLPANTQQHKKYNDFKTFSREFSKTLKEDELDQAPDFELDTYDECIEQFAAALFKVYGELQVTDTFDSVLKDFEELPADISDFDLANKITENYSEVYAKQFPNATATVFLNDGYELLDMLYEYEVEYPFISLTIKAITQMLKQFKTYGATV